MRLLMACVITEHISDKNNICQLSTWSVVDGEHRTNGCLMCYHFFKYLNIGVGAV